MRTTLRVVEPSESSHLSPQLRQLILSDCLPNTEHMSDISYVLEHRREPERDMRVFFTQHHLGERVLAVRAQHAVRTVQQLRTNALSMRLSKGSCLYVCSCSLASGADLLVSKPSLFHSKVDKLQQRSC